VIAGEAVSREVSADVAISPVEDEVLIGDVLAGELELVIEDLGRGLWRFRGEPPEKLRETERPEILR
jgi:hypothetical protein